MPIPTAAILPRSANSDEPRAPTRPAPAAIIAVAIPVITAKRMKRIMHNIQMPLNMPKPLMIGTSLSAPVYICHRPIVVMIIGMISNNKMKLLNPEANILPKELSEIVLSPELTITV